VSQGIPNLHQINGIRDGNVKNNCTDFHESLDRLLRVGDEVLVESTTFKSYYISRFTCKGFQEINSLEQAFGEEDNYSAASVSEIPMAAK
jgi:hypothetical protein